VAPVVLRLLGVIALVLALAVSKGAKDALWYHLTHAKRAAGWVTVLAVLAGLAMWVAGTWGTVFLLMQAMDLQPDEHSLLDAALSAPGLTIWIVGIIIGAQLALLLNVWLTRAPMVESLAWRRRKAELRAEFGERQMIGFNSVRYGMLKKSGAEKPTAEAPRPGRHR
jgi:MFS family permease